MQTREDNLFPGSMMVVVEEVTAPFQPKGAQLYFQRLVV